MIDLNFIEHFKSIPGAISVTEAIALYNLIINNMPKDTIGRYVDFGSHAGKSSSIAIAALCKLQQYGVFEMVDPAFDETNAFRLGWNYFSGSYLQKIRNDVTKFGSDMIIRFYCMTSEKFCKTCSGPISYAFIDTADHSGEPLRAEVEWVEENLQKGGIVAFHDFGNQYPAPAEVAKRMVESGKFESIEIDWEPIISFVKENDLENGNVSWHMLEMQTPNFIGALKRC